LLVSTDGGRTWTLTAATTFAGHFFYRIVVDPSDGRRILAATEAGVFRSVDRGSKWRKIRNGLAWDVSLGLVAGRPAELFVAGSDGLQVSTNTGTTWVQVDLPGAPTNFGNAIARIAVAHTPSDGNVVYVFAAFQSSVWLWRRETWGGPFSEVQLPSLDPPGPGNPGYGISQSWYDWCLAVSPVDRDVVYLGAIDAFKGRKSSAGNWSWADISSRARGDSIHPDQHTIVFDPSNPETLYCGNDGGLFRSPDGGGTWESLNKGLAITEFEYLAQHPRSRTWIIGGTQDNGTLRNRGAGVWDQVALGDGGQCAVEEKSPLTCYHSYYGMAIERSRDGGDTWKDVTPTVTDSYRALFYPPLAADGKTVARAGESVFVSDDEGNHWTEIPMPSGGLGSALTLTPTGQLLVGREDGRIFHLVRRALGWGPAVELTAPRPGAYVSCLFAQPGRPEIYWATCSAIGGGHVYRSDDAGHRWTDLTSNLSDIPAHTVVIDPKNSDRLWLATDGGVFQSMNRGQSWSRFGVGLPRALAVDLAFHARLRLLRVGTRSRGVWEAKIR